MSRAERLLSYSLLALITSKPLASSPTTDQSSEDYLPNSKEKGLLNDEGAWCWREGCEGEEMITVKYLVVSLQHQIASS
jgi:sorting nexin-9/18/33